MYDTHCHLNFAGFRDDYSDIIKHSLDKGMFLNIVGSQYQTSKRAIEIAHEFENEPVYATVGLHPTHLEKDDEVHKWDYEKYKALALDPKVVAIGETGIDLFRSTPYYVPLTKGNNRGFGVKGGVRGGGQKQIFLEHIHLAQELNKPLIIHCRPSGNSFDAYDELLNILKSYNLKAISYKLTGVLHCFLADFPHAQKFLDLGFYISFTGIITFKNVKPHLIETLQNMPLDRIMIETDAPYLTPEPYRGKGRCEPLHVEYTAKKIAEIKGISYKEVIRVTTENGKKLFLNLS